MSWSPLWLSRLRVLGVVGVEPTCENGSTSPKMSTNFRQFPSNSLRYPPPNAPCPQPLPLDDHSDPTELMEIPPPYRPAMPMQLEPSPQRFTSPVSPSSPDKPLPLPVLPLQRPTFTNRPASILLPRGTPDPVPVIPAPSPKSRTGIVPVIPVFHGRRQATKRLKVAGNPVAIPLPTLGVFMSNVLYRVPDDTVVDVKKHLPHFEREDPESGSVPHPAASIPKSPPEMRIEITPPENIPDSPPLPNLPEDTLFNGGSETEQTQEHCNKSLLNPPNGAVTLMKSLGSKNNLTMYGSSSCESLSSMVTASSTESLASMVTASSCDSLTSMANCRSNTSSPGPASPDRSNTSSPHIMQLLNKFTMEDSRASPDLKVEYPSPIIKPVLDTIFTTMPLKTHSPTPRRFCGPSKHAKKWRFAKNEREASVKQQRRVLRTKQAQKLSPQKDAIAPTSVVRADSAAYPRNGHTVVQVPAGTGSELVPNKARSCRGCVKDKKKCDGGRPCHRCQKKGRVCLEPPRTRKRKFNEHFCWDCFHAKRPKYSFPSISNLRRHQRESCVFNPNRITRRVSVIPSQVTANTQVPITLTFGGPLPKAESPDADIVGVYRDTAGNLIQRL